MSDSISDDLRLPLPAGVSIGAIVDLVLSNGLQHISDEQTNRELVLLGMSPEDATLARDRAYGGVARAALDNPANCPSQAKDPIAWESYHRAIVDRTIFPKIYPEVYEKMMRIQASTAQPKAEKPWWRFWR